MKRSKSIHLDRMRKGSLTLCLATSLAACSSDREMVLVSSVEECVKRTRLNQSGCEVEYKKAVEESRSTAPRYPDQTACESEFQKCEQLADNQWAPLMEGFLVPEDLSSQGQHYYHQPIYRYYRPYSSLHNSLMTANGSVVGDGSSRNLSVPESALTSKAASPRTVSRGGFGSIATAKSSSSSSGFRSSWGG